MSTPLAALEQALGYARFKSEAVKDATSDLVKAIQADFVEANYEPSSDTEGATKSLENAMNETDEAVVEDDEDEGN